VPQGLLAGVGASHVGLVQRQAFGRAWRKGRKSRGRPLDGRLDDSLGHTIPPPASHFFGCSASIIPRTHARVTYSSRSLLPVRSSLQNKLKRTLRKAKSRQKKKREGKGAAKTVPGIFGSPNIWLLFNFIICRIRKIVSSTMLHHL